MSKINNYKANLSNIEFISAGAGSGKTYALTEKLYELLVSNKVKPAHVIATTFTIKAASELRERVRQKLLEKGESQLASQMGEALIGTVNSVCSQLIERFSYEAGLSPELSIIDENEATTRFNQSLEANLSVDVLRKMNRLSYRLSQGDPRKPSRSAWLKPIENIAKACRANNITPKALVKMGKLSASSFLSQFPAKTKRNLNAKVTKVIQEALDNIDGQQKNTQTYLRQLKKFKEDLSTDNNTWASWAKLSNSAPAKVFSDISDEVSLVARSYDKHPQLHEELKVYIESIFSIAASTIESFQQLKAEQGLIDFTDQEQLLLSILDNPQVQERLTPALDLLMVDEFQDTSPIQLALFLKLAQNSKKVIFVGDIKQSIYAFRGSDPSLMISVIDAIKNSGGNISILPDSYRSCQGLVQYSNEVFKETFSNTLLPEQVELNPKRKNISNENSVERWQLIGSNVSKRAHALAGAIKEKIESKQQVVDKSTSIARDVKLSDIAIFARANEDVDAIASVFNQHQIPVQKVNNQLINTAEAVLLLACIRRLIDPRDSLASAEIISLSQCIEPEVWLIDRLNYIDNRNKSSNKKSDSKEWGEDNNELLVKLSAFRQQVRLNSPSEIIQHIIIDLHLRSIINQWGPDKQATLQRLNNLDLLQNMAQDYEQQCLSKGEAATLSGLTLWWDQSNQDEIDAQARVYNQDAITIMTYHKSKGLEWPIVILTGLNKSIRTQIWSIRVSSNHSQIDLNKPLEGRHIEYWPFPFGGLSKGINIKEKIESSTKGIEAYNKAIEEDKRLLYVAITRARDNVALVIDKNDSIKEGGWLSSTGVDWLLPQGKTLELPNKKKIKTSHTEYCEVEPVKKKIIYKPMWFEDYLPKTDKLNANLSPSSAQPLPTKTKSSTNKLITIGKRIVIKDSPDMAILGKAVHGVIAAKCINQNFNFDDAKLLVHAMGMGQHIDVNDIIQATDNLINYINQTYPNAKLHAEYPIQHVLGNGQIVKGWIDLLIETDKGWIICDHKSSPKKISELSEIAKGYSGQLKMYTDAIEASSDKPVLDSFIHFAISGVLV